MADRQAPAARRVGGSTESIEHAVRSLRLALRDLDAAKVPLAGAYTELAIFLCDEELRRRR